MLKKALALAAAGLVGAGMPAVDPSAARRELLERDAKFSDDSAARGLVATFTAVVADDAVVVENGAAVQGKAACPRRGQRAPRA